MNSLSQDAGYFGMVPGIFENPANGRQAPVPRHTEIKNTLCRLIRRQLGIDPEANR